MWPTPLAICIELALLWLVFGRDGTPTDYYWDILQFCPYSILQWIQANAPTYPSKASNNPINDEKNRYSNIIACERGGERGGREGVRE